jgi:putative cell wall-binding protein
MKTKIVKTTLAIMLVWGMGACFATSATAVDEGPSAMANSAAFRGYLFSRLQGADRYETAALFAERFAASLDDTNSFGPSGIIIVTGENFPDAIAASGLAGKLGYAVLATSKDTLGQANLNLLEKWKRYEIDHVLIIGSETVIDINVEDELAGAIPQATIERIAGENRYETAKLVYDYGEKTGDWSDYAAFVVTGESFPDGCSITSVAALYNAPVFLVGKDGVLDKTAQEQASRCKRIYIIGSDAVVSSKTEQDLYFSGATIIRLGGADRYATNLEVKRHYFGPADDVKQPEDPQDYVPPNFFYACLFATGDNFADVLTPGTNFEYLTGRRDSASCSIIYIDNAAPVNDICRDLAESEFTPSAYFLGGPSALSETSCTQIMEAISVNRSSYGYEVITSWQ